MKGERLLWLLVAAAALHVFEEYALDWCAWARIALGIRTEWYQFYLVNGILLYFPLGVWTLRAAQAEGVLTKRAVTVSALLAVALNASPFLLLALIGSGRL